MYFRAIWHTFQHKPPQNKKIRPEKKFLIFREIELSNSKIKKFLIFSQKSPPHFLVQARKNEKNPPRKKFLLSQEMELFTSNIKKIQERDTPKKKTLYISGNGNPQIAYHILGNGTFHLKLQKIKKKIHPEKNSNSKIKKFLVFSQKKAFLIFSQKKPSAISSPSPRKPALKKVLMFSQKSLQFFGNGNPEKYFRKRNFIILQETKFSHTFRNGTLLYFGKGIFRTLEYLKLETYSEPWYI